MKLIGGGARRVLAVGALAMGMLVAGGGAAAAGTTAARFRVTAGPLVLSQDGTHYTGTMRVTVRNVGGPAATGANLSLRVPPGLRFLGVDNGGGCILGDPIGCLLFDPPAPGKRATYTLSFGSYAAAARDARRTDPATVTVTPSGAAAGAGSASYAGVLRGTSGSVRHPRPYHPATTYDAVIGAAVPLVEPDGTGGFNVRIPLTAHSRTDAANDGAFVVINAPEGSGFPTVDPTDICMSSCAVPGGWLASGETRSFAVLFPFRPVGPGPYVVTIRAAMNTFPEQPDVTPDDNVVTVDLNIAA